MHTVCVGHRRALTGGIGVGLKHLDALRQDTFSADCRGVVLDLWPRSGAQDPLMNERKVTDVEEVLDYARPACRHSVWPRDQHVIRRIVEQIELWDGVSAGAKTHPDDAIGLCRVIGDHPRLRGRRLLGVGRHEHALPIRSVSPTVVRALNPNAVDDASERQPSAAMYTEVTPCDEFTTRSPNHQVLAEHPGRDWATIRKLLDQRYWVPVLNQDRVIDHHYVLSSKVRSEAARLVQCG